VFLSSFVVCTITALVIGVTGVLGMTDAHDMPINGAALVMEAFKTVIPQGDAIVAIGIILFGYTTIVGWAYYGEKCMEFMTGSKVLLLYRLVFCSMVFLGSILRFEIVWPLADIMNGLMALPNLIALVALSGLVVKESKEFFAMLDREKALMRLPVSSQS
jgi:AGCS family alanine or glycine:cation symporter